jgi:enterochelin esterase-like enzyme
VKIKVIKNQTFASKFLQRNVTYDLILPSEYESLSQLKTLYMNDGQDFEALKLDKTINDLYKNHAIEPFILIAIHTNENRLQEYGTAQIADYKNRGSKAQAYTDFIIQELKPYIYQHYKASKLPSSNFFCGFSLGGLSAIDIVWHHPEEFSKVGVFSGSFWWRKKAYEDGYDDHNDRIMHVLIRNSTYKEDLKFWFQCGTNDEKEDRNGNGIIDSIDDTQDLIQELANKGYQKEKDITYLEIVGGEHNQKTWSHAMPIFIKWLMIE